MPPVSEVDTGPVEESSGGLTRSDCVCPICLDILLEPVTLPCTHTFCKPCFLETVDKSNMCCPLCRKRVSTWARLHSRNKTLINMELWKRIQNAFPEQCERRLQGIEDDDVSVMIPKPRVCQPGELRREYEDQISKLVEEKRALEDAERRASEEYIQRLLAEEEEPLVEARRRQEEKQLEDDERLARLISQELNSGPIPESSWNIKPVDPTPVKKKKPNAGDIEKFLRPVPHKQSTSSESSPNSSLMANKENILNPPKTLLSNSQEDTDEDMPVLDYYGKPSTSNSHPSCSEQTFNSPNNTTAKRKSSETEVELEAYLLNKRPCSDPHFELPPAESSVLSEMTWCEESMRSRWQQEEEDRRLAMRLQRELNRDYSVDRRKGSADGYQLRQKNSTASTSSNPDEENTKGKSAKSSTGPREDKEKAIKKLSGTGTHLVATTSGKSPVSSPTSTTVQSTPLKKGTKQTTLTEMFPNMGS
ncbi:E3 ubiquitin-protein ligase rnf168 [Triplophysa rosa]|uniref:RING-type E3 ubiquitin transferase n=1 Tax=Triplophysa rosa TaxID=992332 RepID=A0A9W7TPG4_TRIRA|nr:E3 ubiquitin-protein ligase rnf168 [Triplophysa rosa]XP_057207088.1 E3 ubiquitin-protein ligase rnf168 [Triplophysa rosa]XP_057207089.1 E3 ubiquitin-protein ligase rnf168 [Triplophysa rosa]KAI7800915.1 putative E3 ubiquitin-protein ligase RNF168 [Triplophysa rosa]